MHYVKSILFFLVFCVMLAFFQCSSYAALSKQLSYQGRLNGADGQPVPNGTYSITFRIYNVLTGGSPLYTETQNVNVENGGFSAYIGSVTPLNLLFNEDYFLGITVGADTEMTPRMKLAIVGTAAFALESDKLQGKAASDFALSAHTHDGSYSPTTHTHTVTVGSAEITDGSVSASDIDATTVQKRVSGTCAGQVMVAINQDGTVTCEADDSGGGGGGTPATTVTSVGATSVVGTSTNFAREDHAHNIPAGIITNSMVSPSAAIGYTKLSLTNSVTDADIAATANIAKSKLNLTNSILFSDIAANGCTSGQIVEYNGTAWVCGTDDSGAGATPASTVTSVGATSVVGTSTNFAREDHAHNISAGVITNAEISGTAAIATSKLSGPVTSIPSHGLGSLATLSAVGSPEITDNSIQFVDISPNACTTGQVMEYNGAAWVCGTDDTGAGGSVTSVGTGTGLTGGPITTSGTISIAAGGVSSTEISDSTITDIDISPTAAIAKSKLAALNIANADVDAAAAIATTKLSGAVTSITGHGLGTLATLGTVGTAEISDSTITDIDISPTAAIAKSKLAALNIANADVDAAAAIATTKLSGAVTSITGHGLGTLATLSGVGSAEITDNTIQFVDIASNACGAGQVMEYNGTAWICGTDDSGIGTVTSVGTGTGLTGGPITGSGTISIAAGGVSGTELAAGAVAGGLGGIISDSSITNDDISAAAAIAKSKLAALNIADADVSGTAAIATTKLSGAVTSITGHGLGTLATLGAVGTAEISDSTITDIDISPTAAIAQSKIAGGPFVVQSPAAIQTVTASAATVTPLVLKAAASPTADIFDVQNNIGTSHVKVNPSGNLLMGNPTFTTAKVSAYETGTTNYGGYFEISNAANANTAVFGTTNGTNNAGYFQITNASNANAAIFAATNGTGAVIGGNSTGTGNLLQLQQSAVDKFVVANNGDAGTVGKLGIGTTTPTTAIDFGTIAGPVIKTTAAAANITLDANDAGNTTVTVTNSAAGFAKLSVEGGIDFSGGAIINSGAPASISFDMQGAGAKTLNVTNSLAGVADLQVEGKVLAFNGTNSVPVTDGVSQKLIQSGLKAPGVASCAPAAITTAVAFPVAFLAAPDSVTVTPAGVNGVDGKTVWVDNVTTTGFDIRCADAGASITVNFYWMAIGNK